MLDNQILEAKITRQPDGKYVASVLKQFAPEYGGGTQTFVGERSCGSMHAALDELRGMVTWSPGSRTDGGK